MKRIWILLLFLSLLTTFSFAQNVGIGNEDPQATLDVNGDVIFRSSNISIGDSIEQEIDVDSLRFSYYRISGPTTDFDISGITAGVDGRLITLLNVSDQTMILHHQDTDVIIGHRIITGTGSDLPVPDKTMVTLLYDGLGEHWIVKSMTVGIGGGSMGWDTSGNNIYYINNVGIGTSDPISPLTIQTDTNMIGLTHIGGLDSIILATKIHESSASIGTMSDDIFSLDAGGAGKVHIWPDGDVVFGEESQAFNLMGGAVSRMNPFDSKITVMTPLNETGYTHIGGDNEIIVNEAIGGVSASLGTMTNNTFRLKTNALGRLHILNDGRVTISPNDYAAHGQLTVYTDNSSFGMSHLGADGQILATHVGGPSGGASIGTHSNHHFRLTCNGTSALAIHSPTLNVGIGIDFPAEKFSVFTPSNSYGISHVSAGGIKLATHIGVVGGSFGTATNHKFRLVSNTISIMTLHPNGNVGIGMDDPLNKLEVNGTIRSKEIIVETANWPDYVFAPSYSLKSLDEVEKFIHENHHLPNIPKAEEIEANGQHMGDLQKKMMEKIEELTLYLIQQDKRIASLEAQLAKQ